MTRLFPSPDASAFAFSQDDTTGWRLVSLHAASGNVTDFGRIGVLVSPDGATTVRATAPAVSIAWSRDGRYLATSPVTAPYMLDVFEASSGTRGRPWLCSQACHGYAVRNSASTTVTLPLGDNAFAAYRKGGCRAC